MKRTLSTILFMGTICCTGAALADAPPVGKPPVINQQGPFQDKGVWLYKTADGKFSFGPAVIGTNETLVMPSPSPEAGGAVSAVEILRHPFDTLGYPMRISLVEKLFAASYQIAAFAGDNIGDLWKYEYGDPIVNEKPAFGTRVSRPAFKAWGPFHGDAVPLEQAPEPEIAAAFNFAKHALNSIENMPESQKELANYGVLFIDDGSTIWVELGPRFGPEEPPHLGCQTQLGRDMVFGYDKKESGQVEAGKFLQCF